MVYRRVRTTRLAKAQRRGVLTFHHNRLIDLLKGRFTDGTIVTDPFDVQQTSVGLEADLA